MKAKAGRLVPPPHNTRMVLAVPYRPLRDWFRDLFERSPNVEVIEAESGLETVELARRLEPRVVMVDLRLPDMSGLEVASILARELNHTRVILMGDDDDDLYHQAALRHGAAYCVKWANWETLKATLDSLR